MSIPNKVKREIHEALDNVLDIKDAVGVVFGFAAITNHNNRNPGDLIAACYGDLTYADVSLALVQITDVVLHQYDAICEEDENRQNNIQ